MPETLELHALRTELEEAVLLHYRAFVDGRTAVAHYELGRADGLARAVGELLAIDPLEAHVRAVAAITARSEEGRELVARARAELKANGSG